MMLALGVAGTLVGCGGSGAPKEGLTVAMMPKNKGNPYFVSCRKGAEEAAKELGVKLLWDGPTETDAAKQNEVVESWITRGVDVIAVSVETRRPSRPSCARPGARGSRWSPSTRTRSRTPATSS
jgi:ABC-type sugar transport system substrate-binding protein